MTTNIYSIIEHWAAQPGWCPNLIEPGNHLTKSGATESSERNFKNGGPLQAELTPHSNRAEHSEAKDGS